MNFVDAIRMATQVKPEGETQRVVMVEQTTEPDETVREVQEAAQTDDAVVTSVQQLPDGASVVRIELRLTPEQTQTLLKGALGASHRYMTLREAAQYLRLSQGRLEELAREGRVPGFQLDGAWRFEKQSLDQWAGDQSTQTTTTRKGVA